MKEFFKDALVGLHLVKDTDGRLGFGTGFAAGFLMLILGILVLMVTIFI